MVLCVLLAALLAMTVSPAAGQTPGRGGELRLVRSYDVPAGGPAAGIGRRGWTYDTALVAAADAATGRHASAARLLD